MSPADALTAPQPPGRPTRRSVLGGLLAAGGLGLLAASCGSGRGAPGAASESARPPTLHLREMTTDPSLLASGPVVLSRRAVPPSQGHPAGMVLATRGEAGTAVHVVTAAHPEGIPVPVHPTTVEVMTDVRGSGVRVLARRAEKGAWAHDLHVSSDLQRWSTQPVAGLTEMIDAYDAHLLLAGQREQRIRVCRLGEDGSLTDLTPLTVPDGQRWQAFAATVWDQRIMLLVERRTGGGARQFCAVTSQDDGQTWGEAVALSEEPDILPSGLLVHIGQFVVLGTRVVPAPDGAGSARHPVAWVSADGSAFTTEQIELPGRTIIPGDPDVLEAFTWDHIDLRVGEAVVRDKVLHATLCLLDETRHLVRSRGGVWSVMRDVQAGTEMLREAVRDEESVIVLGDTAVTICDLATGSCTGGPAFAPLRGSELSGAATARRGGGRTEWAVSEVTREGGQATCWSARARQQLFRVDGAALVPLAGLPADPLDLWGGRLHTAEDGRGLVLGEGPESAAGAVGWAESAEGGQWLPVQGLPAAGSFETTSLRLIEGTYHLTGAVNRDRDPGSVGGWAGALWTSPDLLTWQPVDGLPEVSALEDVVSVGGRLVAVGYRGRRDAQRAAVVRQEKNGWALEIIEADATARAERLLLVGGEARVFGVADDLQTEWALAQDGTVPRVGQQTPEVTRGVTVDLGDGILAAPGARGVQSADPGGVLWTSADAGKTWRATPLPGQEGRMDAVELQRDGKDLVVLASAPQGPRAWRVPDAVAQIGKG